MDITDRLVATAAAIRDAARRDNRLVALQWAQNNHHINHPERYLPTDIAEERTGRAKPEGEGRKVPIIAAIIGVVAVVLAAVLPFVLQTHHGGHPTGPEITYDHIVALDHPTALYTFEGDPNSTTFQDATGHGYDATAIGRPQRGQAGPFGASDGDIEVSPSNYVQTPSLSPLVGDSARTVELWFRLGGQSLEECLFSSGGYQSPAAAFSICVTDGNQYASPRPGIRGLYLQTYGCDIYIPWNSLFDENWHYLAVTLNGSRVTINVDGINPDGFIWNGHTYSPRLPQPFVLPLQPSTAESAVDIGGPGWKPGADGDIDEVAVYGSALSSSDLRSHYEAGASLLK